MNSHVELRCTVEAVPKPIIVTWVRVVDGTEVHVKVQHAVQRNLVVLERNMTIMDNGTWRCKASNLAGGGEDDFVVTVLGKALWTISV